MDALDLPRTTLALADVLEERKRQHAMHGTQTLPHTLDGRDRWRIEHLLGVARARQAAGEVRWPWVLLEEACEAVLASPEERRAELVQTGAVAVQWVEAIDREAAQAAAPAPHDYAPAWQRVAGESPADMAVLTIEDMRERWERMSDEMWRGVTPEPESPCAHPQTVPTNDAMKCADCGEMTSWRGHALRPGEWLTPSEPHPDCPCTMCRRKCEMLASDLPGYDANGSPA